jgi:hypothetical protein
MNEDYLNSIYGGTDEIDPQLAAAGEFLAKVAEEEGVDLDSYSDEEIGDMLGTIMEEGDGEEGGEEGGTEGDDTEYDEKVSHLTVADVAGELAKVAAAEGIDLNQLSREQIHEAYNYVHTSMTDPDFQMQKAAMEEKVAEADMLGRVMAHSFDDELVKTARSRAAREAAGMSTAEMKKLPVAQRRAMHVEKMRGKKMSPGRAGYEGKQELKSLAKKIRGGAGGAVKSLGKALGGTTGKGQLLRGGGALAAGAAGLGAAGYGAGKLMKKKSWDEAVVERARGLLIDSGIDPDTGTKVAEDLDIAALTLLQEHGYEV